jgi:hypothetical protein
MMPAAFATGASDRPSTLPAETDQWRLKPEGPGKLPFWCSEFCRCLWGRAYLERPAANDIECSCCSAPNQQLRQPRMH